MECEHEGAINTVNNKYKINKGKENSISLQITNS